MSLGDNESFWCTEFLGLPVSTLMCENYREAQRETAEQRAYLAQVGSQEATYHQVAAVADVGVAEAQQEHAAASAGSFIVAALPIVGALVLVVGGVGGYLWWKSRKSSPLGLSRLSDDELERLILERQIEAGLA